jgi:hypothetical protein
MCSLRGCDVSRKATLQPFVSQSTTEVEYMAIAEACKKYVWLKIMFVKLCGEEIMLALICIVTVKVL